MSTGWFWGLTDKLSGVGRFVANVRCSALLGARIPRHSAASLNDLLGNELERQPYQAWDDNDVIKQPHARDKIRDQIEW